VILVNSTAQASANAAFEIIRLNGVEAIDLRGTDKTELHEFLRNSGVNIEQMNITLPPEYLEKGVVEIIDGQVQEISNNPLL